MRRMQRNLLLAPLTVALMVLALAGAPRQAAALDSEEMAALDIINQYRSANGLGTVTLNGTLNNVARWMSEDMAHNNYFSHTDSQGRDPFARLGVFGYTYNTWKGENLAAGIDSGQEAFDLWKGSPGHDANMLNPNFTVMGIARAYDPNSTFGWYWTTDFGGQDDVPPPPPPAAPEPEPEPAPVPQQVAPVVTADPTAQPTPEPTPVRTADPTAVPSQAPRWEEIAAGMRPWWDRLTIVSKDGSVLRSVSYLAGRYLEYKAIDYAQDGSQARDGQLILPEQLWPTTFA